MVSKQCPVGMLEKAKELASPEATGPVPDDYDPGDFSLNEVLADIRHEYTNYEGLLHSLPLCAASEPDWPGCSEECPFYHELWECKCPYLDQVHHDLKWAAKEVARILYEEWDAENG